MNTKHLAFIILIFIIVVGGALKDASGFLTHPAVKIVYYVLLVVFAFILLRSIKPRNKYFWLWLTVYLVATVAIALYQIFF